MVRKITAKLYFKIKLPFNKTWYRGLKDAGGFYVKDRNSDNYIWTFPIESLPKVVSVIGKPIEVSEEDLKVALDYCPLIKEQVEIEPVKGKGKLEIYELPDVYEIVTVIGKEEQVYRIPKENVLTAWSILLKYPMNVKVKSRDVAEEICKALGIRRYFRRIGDREFFDWEKFFGSRGDYYRYFYLPIKVLEAKGLIVHHKRGEVERISSRGLFSKSEKEK